MNTLKHMSFDDAIATVADGREVPDGTAIHAHCGIVESRIPSENFRSLMRHCDAVREDWRRENGNPHGQKDTVYHYVLVVARHGTEPILDANGDRCGFVVSGTNRRVEA